MERSLESGDYIILTHGEESQLYSIERVTPTEIIIVLVSDTTQKKSLVPEDGTWIVGGTTVRYKIEFRSKEDIPQLLFTEVPEVDTKILNELDDKTLSLVCQLDKYAANLCQKGDLWKQRVIKYFGDKASLMEAPDTFYIIRFMGDKSGTYFAFIDAPEDLVIGVFDGKQILPLTEEHEKLVSHMDGYGDRFVLGPEFFPRIKDYLELVEKKIPSVDVYARSVPIGSVISGLSLMTKPQTDFIVDNTRAGSVVAFFDGENFVPLTPEQIRMTQILKFNYIPDRVPPIPEGFVHHKDKEYEFEPSILTFDAEQVLEGMLYKGFEETWKEYYQRINDYFDRIWVVVASGLGEIGEWIDILGMYKTKVEAADAIIQELKEYFEKDASGIPKFDLGPFGYYATGRGGAKVTADELKELLIKNIGVQTSSTYYKITFIKRSNIPS